MKRTYLTLMWLPFLCLLVACQQEIKDPSAYLIKYQDQRSTLDTSIEHEGLTYTATYFPAGQVLAKEVLQDQFETQAALDKRQDDLAATCQFLLRIPEGSDPLKSATQVQLTSSSASPVPASFLQEEARNSNDRFYHIIFPVEPPNEDATMTLTTPSTSVIIPFEKEQLSTFPLPKFLLP